MKADNLAQSLIFVRKLTSNLFYNPSSTVLSRAVSKEHAKAAVAGEVKLDNQTMHRANKREQAALPSPLPEVSPDASRLLSKEKEKRPNKRVFPHQLSLRNH